MNPLTHIVIPPQAGIQGFRIQAHWIRACAGMTETFYV